MNGYFSRIGRQSGMLISGHDTQATTARITRDAPLERDEVVMVAPSPLIEVPAETKHRRTPEEGSAYRPAPRGRGPIVETGIVSPDSPQAIGDHLARPGTELEPHTSGETITRSSEAPAGTSARGQSRRRVKTDDPHPIPIEADVAVGGVRGQVAGSADAATGPAAANFFSRTIEIIEGNGVEVERDEAQNIVIHEIQQWVASGWEQAEQPLVENDARESRRPVTEIRDAREPGVARIIGELRNEMVQEARHESFRSNEPAETHFDLSIGTISVVIDGDDRPPSPPAREVRSPAQNTEPRSSRLRRSYL